MFLSNRVILSNLSFIFLSIFIFFSSSCVQSKPRISDKNIVLKPTIMVNTITPTAIPKTIDATPTSTPIPTVSDEEKIVPPFPQQPDVELSLTTVPKPTAIVPTILPVPGDTFKSSPPNSYVQEMARLIYEKNIDPSKLYLLEFYPYKWSDSSYGCPSPGVYYDDSLGEYPGYKYFLSDGSNTWEYHVDIGDTVVFRCDEIEVLDGPTINLYKELNLEKTQRVVLLTRNFVNFKFEEIGQISIEDTGKLLSVLNLDIPIMDHDGCTTIFRIDFYTPDSINSIDYLCANDKNVITGSQSVFESKRTNAPSELGSIVGNYLTGKPIPQLPE
tara:strand:- start:1 stop:987 length:987 start_codon:yes stop_codon:yes gene_type:complete